MTLKTESIATTTTTPLTTDENMTEPGHNKEDLNPLNHNFSGGARDTEIFMNVNLFGDGLPNPIMMDETQNNSELYEGADGLPKVSLFLFIFYTFNRFKKNCT